MRTLKVIVDENRQARPQPLWRRGIRINLDILWFGRRTRSKHC